MEFNFDSKNIDCKNFIEELNIKQINEIIINKDENNFDNKNQFMNKNIIILEDDNDIDKTEENKNILLNIKKSENLKKKNLNEIESDNNIINNYKELIKDFNDFNESTLKGIIKLKNSIKKIEKTLLKTNIKKKNIKSKDWGFTEQRVIPKSIELFFNLDSNSKLSRTEIGSFFQDYIEKNNLKGNINIKNKIDKRIYKVDDKLAKLFNLTEEDKNKINSCSSPKIKYPNGFNFYNYQTWIKKLYIED
jgi:acetone carboxylase gamma subunit